jgi:DNA-binding MarR family transcriptional regulator
LVDRLEAINLVERTPSKEDRRKVTVKLTRAGRVVLEKLYRVHHAELRTVGPQLSLLLQKAAQQIPEESGSVS